MEDLTALERSLRLAPADPAAVVPAPPDWRPGVRQLEADLLERFPQALAGCWRQDGRIFVGVVGPLADLPATARALSAWPGRLRFHPHRATLLALREALETNVFTSGSGPGFEVHIGWLDHRHNGIRLGISGDLDLARRALLGRPHVLAVTLEEEATAC
ncbi:hypothetical protein GKE82_14425 [Conexibacter sp. W3-3-2]|uniref:hypothetical protein n=1 Tax=Conexibacter sp. W3-3-2 TaxID=2675227 RepID=UPI0012B8DD42|nr:hypothetical protein [Conexibacter sp. W3-3-2]MTD45450.1 hypothetical protein [Conexibacter sp. W3-3-2]